MEDFRKSWIEKIASKLWVEGMNKENYNQTEAIKILKDCVAGDRLIEYLKEFEKEIIELL